MIVLDYDKITVACANRAIGLTAAFKESHIGVNLMSKIKAGGAIRPATAGRLAKTLNVDVRELLADA